MEITPTRFVDGIDLCTNISLTYNVTLVLDKISVNNSTNNFSGRHNNKLLIFLSTIGPISLIFVPIFMDM